VHRVHDLGNALTARLQGSPSAVAPWAMMGHIQNTCRCNTSGRQSRITLGEAFDHLTSHPLLQRQTAGIGARVVVLSRPARPANTRSTASVIRDRCGGGPSPRWRSVFHGCLSEFLCPTTNQGVCDALTVGLMTKPVSARTAVRYVHGHQPRGSRPAAAGFHRIFMPAVATASYAARMLRDRRRVVLGQ